MTTLQQHAYSSGYTDGRHNRLAAGDYLHNKFLALSCGDGALYDSLFAAYELGLEHGSDDRKHAIGSMGV